MVRYPTGVGYGTLRGGVQMPIGMRCWYLSASGYRYLSGSEYIRPSRSYTCTGTRYMQCGMQVCRHTVPSSLQHSMSLMVCYILWWWAAQTSNSMLLPGPNTTCRQTAPPICIPVSRYHTCFICLRCSSSRTLLCRVQCTQST